MSELLYLILPESSSCTTPTISLAKKNVLDSNYVGSFITEIENIMWIYDIEDFCILYDSNNVKAFLSFFDLEENGEFYNTKSRLRRLFRNSVYKQCALDISEVDSMTITVLDEEQRVCNIFYDIIIKPNTERYRSGYNGTVLKTVVRQRTVGSNPTLSAIFFIQK